MQLQEANRAIAKLKGEILKLSTEAQNAQFQGNTADDELIEENEDLKCQVRSVNSTVMRLFVCLAEHFSLGVGY